MSKNLIRHGSTQMNTDYDEDKNKNKNSTNIDALKAPTGEMVHQHACDPYQQTTDADGHSIIWFC